MTTMTTKPKTLTKSSGKPAKVGTMDYKVKDINLHEFGRNEIRLAEAEMPGLMAIRAEY
jgi:adenosylhomocysteinase